VLRCHICIHQYLTNYYIGTLQACINAATMALIDAGIPMIDYVCASTAGCIDKQPVLGKKCDLFIDIV
jgi:exosome complex component RRP41